MRLKPWTKSFIGKKQNKNPACWWSHEGSVRYKIDPMMTAQPGSLSTWRSEIRKPSSIPPICPSKDVRVDNPVNEGWRHHFAKVNSAVVHLQPHVRKHKHAAVCRLLNTHLREQQRSSNTAAERIWKTHLQSSFTGIYLKGSTQRFRRLWRLDIHANIRMYTACDIHGTLKTLKTWSFAHLWSVPK